MFGDVFDKNIQAPQSPLPPSSRCLFYFFISHLITMYVIQQIPFSLDKFQCHQRHFECFTLLYFEVEQSPGTRADDVMQDCLVGGLSDD